MATLGGLEEVGARDQQSENEVYDSPRPLVAGPHLLASWPPAQRQGRDSGWHGGASRPRGRPAPAGERPNLSRGKKPEVCLSVPFTWPQGRAFLSRHQHRREVFRPLRPPPSRLQLHTPGGRRPLTPPRRTACPLPAVRGPGRRPRCRHTRPDSRNCRPSC